MLKKEVQKEGVFVWVEKYGVTQSYRVVTVTNKLSSSTLLPHTHLSTPYCPSPETKQPANNDSSLSRRLIVLFIWCCYGLYIFLGLLESRGKLGES